MLIKLKLITRIVMQGEISRDASGDKNSADLYKFLLSNLHCCRPKYFDSNLETLDWIIMECQLRRVLVGFLNSGP